MKATMKAVCPPFNTHRMLREYTEKYYIPACRRYELLSGSDMQPVKAFAEWKARIHRHWSQVRVESVESDIPAEVKVGMANEIITQIYLGELTPDDVAVELYYGSVDAGGEILSPRITEMETQESPNPSPQPNGMYTFVKQLTCQSSGMQGFTVRIVPRHPEQVQPFETGLIRWG
jgi:starch phosphorylase